MRKLIGCVLLLAAGVASAAQAELHPLVGYMRGNDYRQMSEDQRLGYVAGAFDGFLAASLLAKEDIPRPTALVTCVANNHITPVQLLAIVDKFMTDHPERWGDGMQIITFSALAGACIKDGAPF